jgi:hypothetical protein
MLPGNTPYRIPTAFRTAPGAKSTKPWIRPARGHKVTRKLLARPHAYSVAVLSSLALAVLALPKIAGANDSSAELAIGGLVFTKNTSIEMLSEDLFLSTEQIRVRYRFYNSSNDDVVVHVAFPLPDLKVDPDDDVTVVPTDDPLNFVGFSTDVDGQAVHANIEQKAIIDNQDKSAELRQLGISLSPYHLPHEISAGLKSDLERRGFINGGGIPNWTLKTTFYWEQRFPARRELVVEHRYKPSVGSTVYQPTSDLAEVLKGPLYSKYCIEKSFLNDLSKKHDQFGQVRIDYILTTGANWSGPIRQFRVVVDKGAPESLVSFCGQNVRKIAPAQFEMKLNNFIPRSNLSVLILERHKQDNGSQNQGNDNPSLVPNTSCGSLWNQRNSILKAAGYCFKTPRGIAAFGNAGCRFDDERSLPLSDKQRADVSSIRTVEAAKSCR